MLRNLILIAPLCAAMVLTGSLAHAQYGGVQVQLGSYGRGLGIAEGYGYSYGPGNPYYDTTFYRAGYNSNPYRSYGNQYSNFGPGYGSYAAPNYYGGGVRYQATRNYSIPAQRYQMLRYRGR